MVKIWTVLLINAALFRTKRTIPTTNQILSTSNHSLNLTDTIHVALFFIIQLDFDVIQKRNYILKQNNLIVTKLARAKNIKD
jgi:hypothetical protein